MRKNELLEAINKIKARSAWNKGVKIYAYELVEALEVISIHAPTRGATRLASHY